MSLRTGIFTAFQDTRPDWQQVWSDMRPSHSQLQSWSPRVEEKLSIRAIFALGILSCSILAAQSPAPPQPSPSDDAKTPQNSGPNSPEEGKSDTSSSAVYLVTDPQPMPLERASITFENKTEAGKGEVYITIPNEKSSFRTTANPSLIVEPSYGFVEDVSHPFVISRLKASGGVRQYRVQDRLINQIDTHHGPEGVHPMKPLAPGEYMVTIRRIEDLRDGDWVFLFGVD
jgi:hypothetical protein